MWTLTLAFGLLLDSVLRCEGNFFRLWCPVTLFALELVYNLELVTCGGKPGSMEYWSLKLFSQLFYIYSDKNQRHIFTYDLHWHHGWFCVRARPFCSVNRHCAFTSIYYNRYYLCLLTNWGDKINSCTDHSAGSKKKIRKRSSPKSLEYRSH